MQRIADPLELLTAQHDQLDKLIARVATARDLQVRSAAFDRLADKLVEHLAVKQELVYPIAKSVISEATLTELLAEHVEIKRVLADLLWFEIEDAQFDSRLETLMTLVEGHMQWQEDELFVTLAQSLMNDQLVSLGESLNAWFDRGDTTFMPNTATEESSTAAAIAVAA
ncbi:MAG: hemerythrin domain-containing protein [Deltaproteobacteria bacterium]|nr:hemerythrin domain-containing protein [Deltaproteobacteria bacterium]